MGSVDSSLHKSLLTMSYVSSVHLFTSRCMTILDGDCLSLVTFACRGRGTRLSVVEMQVWVLRKTFYIACAATSYTSVTSQRFGAAAYNLSLLHFKLSRVNISINLSCILFLNDVDIDFRRHCAEEEEKENEEEDFAQTTKVRCVEGYVAEWL